MAQRIPKGEGMEPKKPPQHHPQKPSLGERLFDIIDELEVAPPAPSRGGKKAGRQIAVALHHEHGADRAPMVVAQGYGAVADKILRLAFDHDVKVRRDPELAQVLMAVEVNQEIPVEAFAAVAEILSYVYQANSRLAEGAPPAAPAADATLT
jgi:flagellar biosynthesis protein